jgi:outer membrane receptor for ferrienterochelin and colicins
MLNLVPGFSTIDGHIGNTPVMVRGAVEAFNQKVLFLLDGVPYWMPTHSDIPMNGVPFESIDYIEVIRGPGSVLHGTNASGGVINVVTRVDNISSLFVSKGEFARDKVSTYYNKKINHGSLSVSAEIQTDSGSNASAEGMKVAPVTFADQNIPTSGEHKKTENYKSIHAKFIHKKTNVILQTFQSNTSGFALSDTIISRANRIAKGYLLHVDQGIDLLSDKLNLNLYTDYNNFFHEILVQNTVNGTSDATVKMSNEGKDNYRFRGGMRANYNPTDKFSILLGTEYERRSWGTYSIRHKTTDELILSVIDKGQSYEISHFAQMNAFINKDLKL